jgi:hypothetical protein
MSKPTMSEQEARKKLEEATAVLEKQITKGKALFAERTQGLTERLGQLDAEIASVEAKRAQLEAYKDHAEGAFHYQRMELLHRGHSYLRRKLKLELACIEHNANVLEAGPAGGSIAKGENPFRVPEGNPAYLEASAYSDLYYCGFHWLGHASAIDTLMRVGANEPALACADEAQEQACKERANALRQAIKGNLQLTQRVTRMAADLQEAAALLDWGKGALQRLEGLPAEARMAALVDADWAKLNAKALMLGSLEEQVAHIPALAALFAPPEPPAAEVEAIIPQAEAAETAPAAE